MKNISDLLKLARPEILAMKPYSSARHEQKQGKVWLNANENPWPKTDAQWNRYPDPQPERMLKLLSDLYQLSPNQLLAARGSDEGIDLLLRVFCKAGKEGILICPPTYGMYAISATIQDAFVRTVPSVVENNFALDAEKILNHWEPNIKLIFLCSPNNPTGNTLNAEEIIKLAQALDGKALIVVDEAYIEFANTPSISAYINEYPNLIVLRTLSKAYGLAGVRCGCVCAHPEIINLLKKIIAPYPVPVPVMQVVCEALQPEQLKIAYEQVAVLKSERQKLFEFLSSLKWVKKIWPSEANYLLLHVDDAKKIMTLCHAQGIVIRDRSYETHLENCIRISVGTPEENQLLIEVLSHV